MLPCTAAADPDTDMAAFASPTVPRIPLLRRILLVDDGDGNMRLARLMLLHIGCEETEATDGD